MNCFRFKQLIGLVCIDDIFSFYYEISIERRNVITFCFQKREWTKMVLILYLKDELILIYSQKKKNTDKKKLICLPSGGRYLNKNTRLITLFYSLCSCTNNFLVRKISRVDLALPGYHQKQFNGSSTYLVCPFGCTSPNVYKYERRTTLSIY